jgi:hypothetical protein
MLAHHPLTGKEVRIIQTDASLVKENKTLSYGPSSAHIESVSEDLNSFPTYSLILRPTPLDAFLGASKRSRIIVVSKEAFEGLNLTTDEFKKLDVKNMIYLHEIHLMYPHLGGAWNGTPEDAVVLLAGLLRYNKIIGENFSLDSTQRNETLGITVAPSEKPMRLWWVTQFYTTEKKRRVRELKRCLEVNTDSPLIDRIILLNERVEDFIGHEKIEEIVIGKRLTYDEVFKRIADFPDDVMVAFANADICIDNESWKNLWSVKLENKFIALLRYDVPDSEAIKDAKLFGPRPDSQDTWIIRAADVKSRGSEIWKNLNFKFGHMGCDNALALEMLRQKFLVTNPSLTIKTWHFHSSEVRNYNNKDILERPVFHYVDPTGIHDLKPIMKWSSSEKITVVNPSPLRRPLLGSGVSDWQRITKNVYKEGDNLYVPEEEVIFEIGECFQTCDGLVFDKEKMYIGPSKKASEIWSNASMHGLMPTLEVERALVVPWTAVAERSREMYCLRYLSKVLRLWSSGPGDFFANQNAFFEPILSLFNWGVESLPVLPREKDALIWAKSAICFPVNDAKYVLKEDIDALRKYLKGWKASAGATPCAAASASASCEERRLVIVEDNFLLKADAVAVLEAKLIESGWTVNVMNTQKASLLRLAEIMSGAHGIVCAGNISCYGWNWMLPEGACVFEFNGVTPDALELSSACGLKHYMINIIQNEKEKREISREQKLASIIDEINGAFAPLKEKPDVDGPTIWMPKAAQGFFGHPGDSFREMVRLWASSGYVTVKEHSGTMVWWDKVGADGVLLYDRPTNEWRLAADETEKEWRLALFGNPKPPASDQKSVPWFFWPRRPSLVENLAPLAALDYDAREGLVFYGRIENAVQARRRKGDWASVCSEWCLVDGDTKYPYTQEEYLERLGKARFGLCLAGYGYKCHREIECMAMGCVPVVAADVDMDSYAVPPVAGLHYLRVNGPEDVAAAIGAVSKEDWTAMSAACRQWWSENASCAGSFALTKRLVSQ